MDNVLGAFEALQKVGSSLQIHTGAHFPKGYNGTRAPYVEHFQGIQRIRGTNRLVLSGSGTTEHAAHLIVATVGSKAEEGVVDGALAPHAEVTAVASFDLELDHAGGFSIWGEWLVVGAEASCSVTDRIMGRCEDKSRVHFYSASPEGLAPLPYTVERPNVTAGAVALMQEEDGRFLLMAGRVDSSVLDFYRSQGTSLAEDPNFSLLSTWRRESLTTSPGVNRAFRAYQNVNMVMQKGGQLFMIGLCRSKLGIGPDYASLFTVDVPETASGKIHIRKVAERTFTGEGVNFQAAAGIFVASRETLMIYGSDWVQRKGVIAASEFSSGCSRDTGATCRLWGCSSKRGPTTCISGECFCQQGYCVDEDGECKPSTA